jgi:hypothetical protein
MKTRLELSSFLKNLEKQDRCDKYKRYIINSLKPWQNAIAQDANMRYKKEQILEIIYKKLSEVYISTIKDIDDFVKVCKMIVWHRDEKRKYKIKQSHFNDRIDQTMNGHDYDPVSDLYFWDIPHDEERRNEWLIDMYNTLFFALENKYKLQNDKDVQLSVYAEDMLDVIFMGLVAKCMYHEDGDDFNTDESYENKKDN